MNCFQLVKNVLDDLYESIPETSGYNRDDLIRKALRYLERKYLGLAQGQIVQYNHQALRFAYIYRFVTSHANLIYQIISSSTDLSELFKQRKVSVTCVGSGPGSDVLGIIKHILLARVEPMLRCIMMDRKSIWENYWDVFARKLPSQVQVAYSFQTFDIIDAGTWATSSRYLTSDLFTMSYFMSEINSLRIESEPFFVNLFRNVKAGALFLYIDNNSPHFYNWFDSLAAANHIEILRSDEGRMYIMDLEEEKTDLGEYYEKFESPQLKPNVAFRICRKV
jgi:SAM-dependent methyltransferase